MTEKQQKIFLKISLGLAVVISTVALTFVDFDSKKAQTSLLSRTPFSLSKEVKNYSEPFKVKPADLSIEEVKYEQIGKKSTGFYSTYKVTMRIRNRGHKILNKNVVLLVDGQETKVSNTTSGTFSLNEDQEYLLNSFEVKFDERLNTQILPLEIQILDQPDLNLNNNTYDLVIDHFPALLKNISLTYNTEKQLTAHFDHQINLKDYTFYIISLSEKLFDNAQSEYRELNLDNAIYQYGFIPATKENSPLRTPHEIATFTAENDLFIPQSYLNQGEQYLQIRAVQNDKQHYLISDIIQLPLTDEEPLNNAQFAKLLVEEAKIPLHKGQSLFTDVQYDQWYAPYVETLHNLGLLGNPADSDYKFSPGTLITRGEATKIILDYFDINLVVGNFSNTFIDVNEDNRYFFYVETLRADANSYFIDKRFNTNHPATRSFVTNLINKYRTP